MAHASVHHLPVIDSGLRWLARLASLFVLAVFLSFLFGEGLDPARLSRTELLMTAALFVSLFGLVLGWTFELAGGALTIAGITAFYLMNYAATGRIPEGPLLPLAAIPGVLYLVCWWRHAR
jgi:hypothetical protein